MALNTYRKTWKQIQVHNSAESWFKDQREAQPTWINKNNTKFALCKEN